MDIFSNYWVALSAAAVAGLLLGAGLMKLIGIRSASQSAEQSQALKEKLANVEEEFEDHKDSVAKHFDKTSELVNELTESYAKVYNHLAEGAAAVQADHVLEHKLDAGRILGAMLSSDDLQAKVEVELDGDLNPKLEPTLCAGTETAPESDQGSPADSEQINS